MRLCLRLCARSCLDYRNSWFGMRIRRRPQTTKFPVRLHTWSGASSQNSAALSNTCVGTLEIRGSAWRVSTRNWSMLAFHSPSVQMPEVTELRGSCAMSSAAKAVPMSEVTDVRTTQAHQCLDAPYILFNCLQGETVDSSSDFAKHILFPSSTSYWLN